MNNDEFEKLVISLDSFCSWLSRYGEFSYDHQSFFASKLGRAAKALYYRKPLLGTLAVAPMVLCEALIPSARSFFWKPQRFPIADAHYAMGFAFLGKFYEEDRYYQTAVHFLEVLLETRSSGYENYGWGYPFNWQTRAGIIKEGVPLITTVPYVYEAFSQVYELDNNKKWLEIMRSIAEHAFKDYHEWERWPDCTSCAYTPNDDAPGFVVNASAYRAFLLTKAGMQFSDSQYLDTASRNLNFVLASQNEDGSWYYSTDGERTFVDHFHTCFVLKALRKIEELTGCPRCRAAIERGVSYYLKNLFDEQDLPIPFSRRPRLTVYRRELYDYAECINLAVLLFNRFPELEKKLWTVVGDLLVRWQKSDGSWRGRELMVGWDNIPMHRWAQSQVFRSLCFLLSRTPKKPQAKSVLRYSDQPFASTSA